MPKLLRKLCLLLVLLVVASCGGGRSDDSDLTTGTSKLMTSSSTYGQPASTEAQAAAAAELRSYFAGDKTRVLKDPSLTESASIDTKASASGFTPRAAYRFFNTATGVHFYTVSEEERQRVQSTLPQFQFEGTGFFAVTAGQNDLSPVYRFYNRVSGTHFYTISLEERDHVAATWPNIFSYEGIAWYASKVAGPGWLPIYRFFNTQTGTHFYSATPAERDNVIANLPQFSYEGIGYYIRLNGELDSALVGTDANSNGVRDSVEQVLARLSPNATAYQANVAVAAAYEKVLSEPLPNTREQALQTMGVIACAETAAGSDLFESNTFGLLNVLFDTDARSAQWSNFVRRIGGGYLGSELSACTSGGVVKSGLAKAAKAGVASIPEALLNGRKIDGLGVRVLYVNGIMNGYQDARNSSRELALVLGSWDDFDFDFFHNLKDGGLLVENAELKDQASMSRQAVINAYANNRVPDSFVSFSDFFQKYKHNVDYRLAYNIELAKLYLLDSVSSEGDALSAHERNILTTRELAEKIKLTLSLSSVNRLVLVPHSQGNYYVESALAVVLEEIRTGAWAGVSAEEFVRKVRVFGVAPVSSTSWSGAYIRHEKDIAVGAHVATNSPSAVLESNRAYCVLGPCWSEDGYSGVADLIVMGKADVKIHGFVETYLNQNLFVAGTGLVSPRYVNEQVRGFFPTVTDVTPTDAVIDQATTFTVKGSNLPLTAIISIADAECEAPVNRTATSFQQTCTPRGATGTKAITVKTNTDANGGAVIDDSFVIEFTKPISTRFKLVPGYSSEECILDTMTGLVWEGKTTDGLRSVSNTYTMATWDNAVWGWYIPEINNLQLCGRSSWTLPTFGQLTSLFSLSEVDREAISGFEDGNYWTITSPTSDGNYVYVVNPFGNTYMFVNRNGLTFRLRLVSTQ